MMCWYSFIRTAGACTTRVPKWMPRFRETPWSLPVYALIVPIAYRRLYAGVRVAELGGITGKRSVLSVWANGVTNSAAIVCAYATGWALMARTANRSARSLLAWVNAAVSGTNPLVVPCQAQIRWFQR